MKATKLVSLLLAFALGGIGLGVTVYGAPWLESIAPNATVAAAMIFGAFVLSFVLILLPVTNVIDRAIRQLEQALDGAAQDNHAFEADRIPRWLRKMTRSLVGTVDRFQQREQTLRHQLRDLEIRNHRIAEQRQQTEAVLHVLRDPVIVTDAYGDIMVANEAAAHAFGFSLEEAIHTPVNQVIRDVVVTQLLSDARDQPNFAERRAVSHERHDADDVNRLYDLTLTCVQNHKGEVGGVVLIMRDLSREREISTMKSDFVSKASHELRTPLSSIKAYVEMLVDDEAQDEIMRREWCNIIFAETERLERLVDNMLNISRIEAGIVQIDRATTDFGDVIHRACDTIGPQARERSIAIHHKTSTLDLTVEGDSDMLFQVVLNLVSNAVKYTPEGGRVTVSADTDNLTRSVIVSVNDTGLGIPPDSVPKLFDKFYRVDNYKRVAKGTGLGLSLCKHIVETLHHGQIGVESELGMGSRFWFSVPMRYEGSNAAA
ncbi:MAG: ATP-binding protein [Planctomycetota bacterium]